MSGSEIFCAPSGDAEANAEAGTSDKMSKNDISAAAIFKEGFFMTALLSAVLMYVAQYESSISRIKYISPCGHYLIGNGAAVTVSCGHDFVGTCEATRSAA